jgi:hypothetical protein
MVVHTWPEDHAITSGTVFTDSNLGDWLVRREYTTDDEDYEEVEAKPPPQKKETKGSIETQTLPVTLSIPMETLLGTIQ